MNAIRAARQIVGFSSFLREYTGHIVMNDISPEFWGPILLPLPPWQPFAEAEFASKLNNIIPLQRGD